MSKRGHIQANRPGLITRQQQAISELENLHEQLELMQGVTHSETVMWNSDNSLTVIQQSTNATRTLDESDS